MKKIISAIIAISISMLLVSCASLKSTSRERQLSLGGVIVSEADFGGVERWYAVDKYNYNFEEKVRFQVGYFKNNNIGFVLYENGTIGEEAHFARQGLNLRWDWGLDGTSYKYCIVIEPDGTGLYYDFSTSTDGTAKPRSIYRVYKF